MGAIDSVRNQVAEMQADVARRRIVIDPYSLSPDRGAEPDGRGGGEGGARADAASTRGGLLARLPVKRDPATDRWSGPFLMAPYNTRVVRRSNALSGYAYGRGLRYAEVHDTGTGPVGMVRAVLLIGVLGAVAAGMAWAPTRALLGRLLPAPGEGPSADAMEAGHFAVEVDAVTTTGARYRTTVGADRDPGYRGTAVMLGESALALAEGSRLPDPGGVLTPAIALGDELVRRLREHGFTLEVARVA